MTVLNGRIPVERSGTTFEQWVAINLTASGPTSRAALVAQMTAGLRTDAAVFVLSAERAGLLTGDIALTALGRSRYEEISAAVDTVTMQIYGDMSPEDLETAGRVLLEVTERANALV